MQPKTIGIICILITSVLWAIEPVLAKLAYASSDALNISLVRSAVVALMAFLYVLLTNKGNFKISRKEFSVLAYVALIGAVLADFLYIYAISRISVVNAVVIGHMQPIFIVLFGFMLISERPSKYDYIGMVLMIIAGIFVSSGSLQAFLSFRIGTFADLLIIFATVAWATTTLAVRKYLQKKNAGVISFYRSIISSSVFLLYALMFSKLIAVNIYQLGVGLVVGIGTLLYYEGLKRLKAMQVGSLELSTPFFAAFFGFIILGERITSFQAAGIFLLMIGIYLLSRKDVVVRIVKG